MTAHPSLDTGWGKMVVILANGDQNEDCGGRDMACIETRREKKYSGTERCISDNQRGFLTVPLLFID